MVSENGTPVYRDERLIGTIHRGEFWQTRRPNNFLKWGIAFDAGVLAEVERLGADRVRIKNSETGEIFTASLAASRQYGREVDHGYGRQVAMPWSYWQRSGTNTTTPERPAKTQRPAQSEAAQLTLFGGAS